MSERRQRRSRRFVIWFSLLVLLCIGLLVAVSKRADEACLRWLARKAGARVGAKVNFGSLGYSSTGVRLEDVSMTTQRFGGLRVRGDSLHVDVQKMLVTAKGLTAFTAAGVRARLNAEVNWDRSYLKLEARMPPQPCQDLLSSLPEQLRSGLEKIVLSGSTGVDFSLRYNRDLPGNTIFAVRYDNGCEIEEFGALQRPEQLRTVFNYSGYDAARRPLELRSGPGSGRWVPLNKMSPYLVEGLVAQEDTRFLQHRGISLGGIRSAIKSNLRLGRFKYGASTLTMQLAKNLFLKRDRTMQRKFKEVFFTFYLERYFTKAQILELYFNIVEYGPSLYGIVDASRYYFGRAPRDLDLLESAFLINLLPGPVTRHGQYVRGVLDDSFKKQMTSLIDRLQQLGVVSAEERAEARPENLVFHRPGQPTPPERPQNPGKTVNDIIEDMGKGSLTPSYAGPSPPLTLLRSRRVGVVAPIVQDFE